MTAKRPLSGSLDHVREDLATLDEAIETARSLSKARKSTATRDTIQGLKILRDLVEQREATLDRIKAHLLGR